MGTIHPTGRWLLAFLCASFASITSAAQSPTPIRHVVIVVMENHSFDSIFGTFPGANGATSGLIGTTLVPLNHLNDQPPADYNSRWKRCANHRAWIGRFCIFSA